MRLYRFPDHFCRDSRPYWALFICFVLCNAMLLYTLYTRQPERYRRISRWLSHKPLHTADFSGVQRANLVAGPADQPGNAWQSGTPGNDAPRPANQEPGWGKTVDFMGMTLRDAPRVKARANRAGGRRRPRGVEIASVRRKSVPYLSGFRKGDVIVSVNRMPCRSVDDLEATVRQADLSQGILFDVHGQNGPCYMTIETGATRR
ncbi:MAG TPA: hypothetical protein VM492_14835 [Sumerlaeia bacterium]|nr:hypothetical protein [Sumerlaeia bacterium]HUU32042.1 hypothetical protein [Phycisphaerae bacterium]